MPGGCKIRAVLPPGRLAPARARERKRKAKGLAQRQSARASGDGWHMADGMGQRLRAGRATWRDQIAVRGTGVLAYGGVAAFTVRLCALERVRPDVLTHPSLYAACFLAVVVFHLGSALALIGPDLFRGGAGMAAAG
jgi:hypothetical protein